MMISVLERLSTTALESPLAMISELSFTIQRVYFRKIELLFSVTNFDRLYTVIQIYRGQNFTFIHENFIFAQF